MVINKIDRPGARPDWVVDQVFDLFVNLDATDEQLDFPIIYASALQGIAGVDHTDMADDMTPLYRRSSTTYRRRTSIWTARCRCKSLSWTITTTGRDRHRPHQARQS